MGQYAQVFLAVLLQCVDLLPLLIGQWFLLMQLSRTFISTVVTNSCTCLHSGLCFHTLEDLG